MSRQFKPILHRSVSLLLLLLAFSACKENRLEVPTSVMDRNLPDETSKNVVVTEFDKGSIDYVLKASRIDRYYDKRLVNAFKVDILAYDKKKGGTSVLKADSTIVDDARNMIYANGNVQLTSPGGSVFTKRMIWDRNVDEIIAPDRVTLNREGNLVRGKNLRTNLSVYPTEMDSVSAEGFFGEEYLDW